MSHRFLEGKVTHIRHAPKKHRFAYRYFMADICVPDLKRLQNRYFSLEKFNVMSFFTRDHFGSSDSLEANIKNLAQEFGFEPTRVSRFITLPRIFGFVFNPISLAVCFDGDTPKYMLVEVHNYNKGRIVYPVSLEKTDKGAFLGTSQKDMHVSPFFRRQGEYRFRLEYDKSHMMLGIDLYEDGVKKLTTIMHLQPSQFDKAGTLGVLRRHGLLTLMVVIRTMWQSLKLYKKGLQWHSPAAVDKLRRY